MLALIIAVALAISPTSPDHDSLREQGRALCAAFYQGEFAGLWRRFAPQMQQALGNVDGLRNFRTQVEAEAGSEEFVLAEFLELSGGFRVYQRIARFSKAQAPVEVRWTLATDGKVAGFFVRPLPPDAESPYAGYRTQTDLRLPFRGAWFVFWGGRSVEQNYHAATWDQRYAYDFLMQRGGRTHAGAGRRNEDY